MDTSSCTTVNEGGCREVFRNLSCTYHNFIVWIGKYLTPTQITIGRGLFILPAWYLWIIIGSQACKITAIVIMVISWYGDHLDGAVARATHQVTELGKKLDPLIDKIVFYGSVIVFWSLVYAGSFFPMLALDIISTLVRGNPAGADTSANIFGKCKLNFQVASSLSFAIADVTGLSVFNTIANLCIIIATLLALISVHKRTVPHWRKLPNMWNTRND